MGGCLWVCVYLCVSHTHIHIQGALLALMSMEMLLQAPTEAFVSPSSLYPARLQALSQFRARGLALSGGAQRGAAGRLLGGLSMSEPQSSRVSPCVCVCVRMCVCVCDVYDVYLCVCVCGWVWVCGCGCGCGCVGVCVCVCVNNTYNICMYIMCGVCVCACVI